MLSIHYCDEPLLKASVNQLMYEFVVDFLIGGFEAIGFEKGLEHIANYNHIDKFCVNTEKLLELQNKVELIARLSIGKEAPAFNTTDISGKTIDLYEIDSENVLLFFWASWCPHCKDMIPEINKIYKDAQNNGIQVIGISIDTKIDELRSIINEYNVLWPNVADLKGWDGEIATQYGIVATPSMFLLDKYKTIIGKPINKNELDKFFE